MSHPFLTDFHTMSTFGATERGGVHREAASPSDLDTRAWLHTWLTEHGFTVSYDEIGNQYGTIELVPGAPYVLTGSHLDSQPRGGRFDGAYGVLASAHAAHTVASRVRAGELTPAYNLAVVNWFNEEGSRFAPSMMGSSVYTGKLALADALAVTDHAGTTVQEALAAETVTRGGEVPEPAVYAEIHIEQGRSLENSGHTIGLVDRTWAASKYRVTVVGEQSHTGSTIMRDRKDALYGAALVIVAARELADRFPEGQLHTAISELTLAPNSPVTVAREVVMNLDLRSPDEAVLEQANAMLEDLWAEAATKARVRIDRELTHHWGLLPYQPAGVDLAADTARELGYPATRVMTVAGHDSTNMKDVVPTVMLFVPSVEGISHNELEHTGDADALAGVTMLTEVVGKLVRGDLPASPLE